MSGLPTGFPNDFPPMPAEFMDAISSDPGAFANNLPAGTIVVVAEYVGVNGFSCHTFSQPIIITEPDSLAVFADVTDELCVDDNNGEIILPNGWNDVVGGIPFDVNFSPL